jgi:glycerate kinase
MRERPVLVAPGPFAELPAPAVAGAIGRGLERAGLMPPDLCPVTTGGPGTIAVLLPRLGGETAGDVALLEDGGVALVEGAEQLGAGETGAAAVAAAERIAAAAATGAPVVVVAAGAAPPPPRLPRGPRVMVLCDRDTPREAWAAAGAILEPGLPWILDALGFDPRMRAARAVITGEALLDERTLAGGVVGEIGTRARQAGVPLHALVGADALDGFGKRIVDLQVVREAGSAATLEAAAEELGAALATGAA